MTNSHKVLIVDDDIQNQNVLKSMVQVLGYQAEVAATGPEALEKLAPDVDIVLLDVMMPGMDGYEVARRIRDERPVSDIPIIMITVLDSKTDRLLAVEAGANDFVGKPVDIVELRVRMKSLLKMKTAQDALKDSLKEKEFLLREIHHRVKNNLTTVISLLRLHSRNAVDDYHRALFENAQDRIRAMAIVHEKLYRSDNLAAVNVREYAAGLIDYILAAEDSRATAISVVRNLDDVFVHVNKAIPVGIILTELLHNSLRHAFPNGRNGRLDVSFRLTDQNSLELIVKDDGIGLPEIEDFGNLNSLGLKLVSLFSRQLGSKLEIRRTAGTEFRIEFMQ